MDVVWVAAGLVFFVDYVYAGQSCSHVCAQSFVPVCGEGPDGRLITFSNECFFDRYRCENPLQNWVVVNSRGGCVGALTTYGFDPTGLVSASPECPFVCSTTSAPLCAQTLVPSFITFLNECYRDLYVCDTNTILTTQVTTGLCTQPGATSFPAVDPCRSECPDTFQPLCVQQRGGIQKRTFDNACKFQKFLCTDPNWDLITQSDCDGTTTLNTCVDISTLNVACFFGSRQLGFGVRGNQCEEVFGCASGLPIGRTLFPTLESCTQACLVIQSPCDDITPLDTGNCGTILGVGIRGNVCGTVTGCRSTVPAELPLFESLPACQRSCATAQGQCSDVSTVSFGSACPGVLGAGVVRGKCQTIRGCTIPVNVLLFPTIHDCEASCADYIADRCRERSVPNVGNCNIPLGYIVENAGCKLVTGCPESTPVGLQLFTSNLICETTCASFIGNCRDLSQVGSLGGCTSPLGIGVYNGVCGRVQGCSQSLPAGFQSFNDITTCRLQCNVNINTQCQNVNVHSLGLCTTPLGAALVNGVCEQVDGCRSLVPLGTVIFDSMQECKHSCEDQRECQDLAFTHLGACFDYLGIGVYAGECRHVYGCSNSFDLELFVNHDECRDRCLAPIIECRDWQLEDLGNCGLILGIGVYGSTCGLVFGCPNEQPPGTRLYDNVLECSQSCNVVGYPTCQEQSGVSYGTCRTILGVGVRNGLCSIVTGCPENLHDAFLFKSMADCRATCGAPECQDFTHVDLGRCNTVLGVAMIGGECSILKGCSTFLPQWANIFETTQSCLSTCPTSTGATCLDLLPVLPNLGQCGRSLGVGVVLGKCQSIVGCDGLLPDHVQLFTTIAQCERHCIEGGECRELESLEFGICDSSLGFGIRHGACTEVRGCNSLLAATDVTLFENTVDCSRICTNSRCQEHTLGNFGNCNDVLGVGVMDGTCQTITGCQQLLTDDVLLFDNVQQCRLSCFNIDQCQDYSVIELGSCDQPLGYGIIFGGCNEVIGCGSALPTGAELFSSATACDAACSQGDCRELSSVEFGPCAGVLGIGVVDGECDIVRGCADALLASGAALFDSFLSCQRLCGANSGECRELSAITPTLGACLEPLGYGVVAGDCTIVRGCTNLLPANLELFNTVTQCRAACGFGACFDVSSFPFGNCGNSLGVAIVGGKCSFVTGCTDAIQGFNFFHSIGDCAAICLTNGCVDFENVDVGSCTDVLGFGVRGGDCVSIVGCANRVPPDAQLYPDASSCYQGCGFTRTCEDISGVALGSCLSILGVGRLNNQCSFIRGCLDRLDALDIQLFNTIPQCETVCGRFGGVCTELSTFNFGGCNTPLGHGMMQGQCSLIRGCTTDFQRLGNVNLWDNMQQCEEQCSTDKTCRELITEDFGTCPGVLGYGVTNGDCSPIQGCAGSVNVVLFATLAECTAQCTVDQGACRDLSLLALGNCPELLGVGVVDRRCTRITGCAANLPPTLELFVTMDECARLCGGQGSCSELETVNFGLCGLQLGGGVVNGRCTSIRGCPAAIPHSITLFPTAADCVNTCALSDRCRDYSLIQLDDCNSILGVGVFNGRCSTITGCTGSIPPSATFFSTPNECQATCNSISCREMGLVRLGNCGVRLGVGVLQSKCTFLNGCPENLPPGTQMYPSLDACRADCEPEKKCTDVYLYDFGRCGSRLGAAVWQGKCTTITGCSQLIPKGHQFFESLVECRLKCGEAILPDNDICSSLDMMRNSNTKVLASRRIGEDLVRDGRINTVWASRSLLRAPSETTDIVDQPFFAVRLPIVQTVCRVIIRWPKAVTATTFEITTNDDNRATTRVQHFEGTSRPGQSQEITLLSPNTRFIAIRGNHLSDTLAIAELQINVMTGGRVCLLDGVSYGSGDFVPPPRDDLCQTCVCIGDSAIVQCKPIQCDIPVCSRPDQLLLTIPGGCCPVCITTTFQACAGPSGFTCAIGTQCIDDPRDQCDVTQNVRCPGICVTPPGLKKCSIGGHLYSPGEAVPSSLAGNPCGVCVCGNDGGIFCAEDTPCVKPVCQFNSLANGLRPLLVTPPGECCQTCAATNDISCISSQPNDCPVGFACIDDPSDVCIPRRGDVKCTGLCTTLDPRNVECNMDCSGVVEDSLCAANNVQIRTFRNECELKKYQCNNPTQRFEAVWDGKCLGPSGKQCNDLALLRDKFGECKSLLGYGVVFGRCTPLLGCRSLSGLALYDTDQLCQVACGTGLPDDLDKCSRITQSGCGLEYSPVCVSNGLDRITFGNLCLFDHYECTRSPLADQVFRFSHGGPCTTGDIYQDCSNTCPVPGTAATPCPANSLFQQGPGPCVLNTAATCVQLIQSCPTCADLFLISSELGTCSRLLGVGVFQQQCKHITGCQLPSSVPRLFTSLKQCTDSCIGT